MDQGGTSELPVGVSIGDCSRDLEIIVQAGEREDIAGQVLFLPL